MARLISKHGIPIFPRRRRHSSNHTQNDTCDTHSTGPPQFTKAPLQFLKFLVTPWSQKEKEGLARTMKFRETGMGYFREQSTKPQTVGYSFADSPVGLLAWIYEKLHDWTDNYPWTDDEGM